MKHYFAKMPVGTIYCITNGIDEEVYVGSTVKDLSERLRKHAVKAKSHAHRKVYKHFNSIGWNNLHITSIEEVDFSDLKTLRIREQYWVERISTLNSQDAWCEIKDQKKYLNEYYQKNKKLLLEKNKIYRDKNKGTINARRKRHRDRRMKIRYNCECGSDVAAHNKSRHERSKKHLNYISERKIVFESSEEE